MIHRTDKKEMNRLMAYRVTRNESYFKWGRGAGRGIEIPSQEGEVKSLEKGISGRRKHQNIKGGKD